MEKRIFLSYSWNDTEDVNRLDNLFSRFQIPLTRDIRDLKYNANIHNFMDGIRMHDKLILYVSDSYLRSVNCMYEASQVLDMQEKVIILLKKGTRLFTINDKAKFIDYWKKKRQEILQMDSCLFQQEIVDTEIACNSIGAFIDFIKRDNRMNEETLDFDVLLDSLDMEKSFPTIVTKTVLDWIAQYPHAKLFDVLALINDLYNSADICFSEFPNIPDGETLYIFRGIQFECDINGVNLLLSITDKKTGKNKAIIYPHLVAIEENNIRSNQHAKYYLYCENPSQKQQCREISSFIKHREPTEEESDLIARGYLDIYRLALYFNVR